MRDAQRLPSGPESDAVVHLHRPPAGVRNMFELVAQ